MKGRPQQRWKDLPIWARWILAITIIGFLDGTGAHVRDLVHGGIHAYSGAPVPAQMLFVGLVLVDPLIAVLLAVVLPAGPPLTLAVMVLDVVANWITDWPTLQQDPTSLWRSVGLLAITFFGLFVVATSIPLLRAIRRTGMRPIR